MLDRRCIGERFVGDFFQRDDAAAAVAAVGRDEQLALRVVDAVAQRFRAEAAKDDAVDRADAGAGEHRDRELGNQRQIDRNAIAFRHAERLQDVRERANLGVQLGVRQRAAIARLAFPHERRFGAARSGQMTVEAVDAGVDLSADEPLRVRRLPVEHRVPRPRPFELAREPRPERLRITLGLSVDALVARDGLRTKLRGRRERAVFAEEIRKFSEGFLVGHAAKDSVRPGCTEGPACRPGRDLSAERREACADLGRQVGVRDGPEPQKRAIVLDGHGGVAAFVGDDREVVVRPGVARVEHDGAAQQVSRVGDAPGRALHERKVHHRLDVARFGGERDAEFRRGRVELAAAQQHDAEVVVRPHVVRVDRNRALKLPLRFVGLPMVLIQKAEVVVHLGAAVGLLEQRAIVRERVVEIADALVVEREAEMIGSRRHRRGSRRRLDDRFDRRLAPR